jgi:high-affinity iron transporter
MSILRFPYRMRMILNFCISRSGLVLLACAVAPAAARAQKPAEIARRVSDITALALSEYRLGVHDGRVTSVQEFDEARQFLEEAQRAAVSLPPAAAAVVTDALDSLSAGMYAHRSAGELVRWVDGLRASLSRQLGVDLDPLPAVPPTVARGAELYHQWCTRCHGVAGRGDGVLARGLDPRPADLTARSLRSTSPLEFYRRINVGVAGTAMPGLGKQLSSRDRWALALFASGLRYTDSERSRGEAIMRERCAPCLASVSGFAETAPVNDDSLAALLIGLTGPAPGDSALRDLVAFARTAAAADVLGNDRGLLAGRTLGETRDGIAAAVRLAQAGDRSGAARKLVNSYLIFERVEAVLKARRPQAATEVERAFADLRGATQQQAVEAVRDDAARLDHMLVLAADELSAAPSTDLLFGQSLVIIVREGFEAILVIGALVAFLVRSGAAERKREIGWGVLWAVGASLLTALGYATIFRTASASQEALEGGTMLVAAVVLFWVSYWLVSKIELKKWQEFVAARMGRALSGGGIFALAAVAFLAVYREGFETVLFYAALFASGVGAPGATAAIASGLVVGLVILGGVYYVMQRYGTRLPLKPFFAVTSALLYLMAFSFAGQGIAELQGAGYVPVTPVSWIPTVPLLGIFPTLQSFLLQALLAAALGLALIWVCWIEPRARALEASAS